MATNSGKKSTPRKPGKAQGKSLKKNNGKELTTRSSLARRFVVAPKSGGWIVRRVGSSRVRTYDTKADAIAAATKTARESKGAVVIHGKDGQIRARLSTSRADSAMLNLWRSTHQAVTTKKR